LDILLCEIAGLAARTFLAAPAGWVAAADEVRCGAQDVTALAHVTVAVRVLSVEAGPRRDDSS
jgi:hypothetical protein